MVEGPSNQMENEVAKKSKKKIVRREYTKADVKELRAHSKAKTPIAKIMKLTKRTEGSLRQKARNLGMSLGLADDGATNIVRVLTPDDRPGRTPKRWCHSIRRSCPIIPTKLGLVSSGFVNIFLISAPHPEHS